MLLFIDDATSYIGAALFAPTESTAAYFTLIEQYMRQHGKPIALYVDKFSVFRPTRRGKQDEQTQFARAMDELSIEIICANSPQAKGRVERANRTLQDRLVKELRLRAINSIDEANRYLPTFLAAHNARFAVPPRCKIDAHKPLADSEQLQRILTHIEERTISKNLTFRYGASFYQIVAPGRERRLQYQRVRIRERDASIIVEHDGHELTCQAIPIRGRPVADSKELNLLVDRTRLGPRQPDPGKQRTPSATHPWKTYRPRIPTG